MVGDRKPILMGAGVAFDAGLFADAAGPFVSADRRVSRLAGFLADESMRIDFFTPPKETPEKSDLFRGWRGVIERHEFFQDTGMGMILNLADFELEKLLRGLCNAF